LRLESEDGLVVTDLASTNGVYVDGARLTPLRRRRIETPASLDVGTEGTLRLEVRAGVRRLLGM
jgi:pSer/pThr/pTyr-binding forkhead associated (FHA) protein